MIGQMNIFRRIFLIAALAVFSASCAEEMTESYDTFEDISLKAWIKRYRPELEGNLQTEGGYYVDVISAGKPLDMESEDGLKPVNDTICWVTFDFSGRDLAGNIIVTRREAEARLVGSFTRQTHYVPYYRYCGEYNLSLVEGTHLAMRNALKLDPSYAASKGLDEEFLLREGSEVVLYMPSRIVGGATGTGGYEGQADYQLSTQQPFVVTMKILSTTKNPVEKEGEDVDAFCRLAANGGLKIYSNDEKDKTAVKIPEKVDDPLHPYNVAERWVSVNDSTAQVYINPRFNPAVDRLTFPEPYKSDFEPYNNIASLEEKIQKALVERFHTDEDGVVVPYVGVTELNDSVGKDNKANIWYIGRFLDGFIFDTNIDEVKELIYGEVASEGTAFDYTPKDGGAITAWFHSIPNLKFGQWAALITTSSFAYGATGQTGNTTTSTSGSSYSSSYYDYLNYYNYYNSYYGNNYYGGYYNNYYNNYYNSYYYDNYYYNNYYGYGYGYGDNYGSSDTTETIRTTTTEIPSYTPLIFQIYIEPKEE